MSFPDAPWTTSAGYDRWRGAYYGYDPCDPDPYEDLYPIFDDDEEHEEEEQEP